MNETKVQLQEMLKALSNSVSGFDAQIAAMQSAVDAIVEAVKEPGDGTVVTPSDKIYTQVDLDSAVNAAVLPLQAEIDQLKGQISEVNAGVDERVAKGFADLKAQLAAAYAEKQVVETQAETGFAELLK
jgi:L-lactate utilization protein LutC